MAKIGQELKHAARLEATAENAPSEDAAEVLRMAAYLIRFEGMTLEGIYALIHANRKETDNGAC